MFEILKNDEDGVISIESCTIFPIFIFVLIAFTNILRILIVVDKNDNCITMQLIERQSHGIETNSNSDSNTYIKDEYIYSDVNDNYTLFFRNISNSYYRRIKIVDDGERLADYSIVNKTIETEFDIWTYSNIARGNYIAKLNNKNLDNNPNKIDVLNSRTLISIVSIDVRKKSYEDKMDIYLALKDDVDKLIKFDEGIIGKDTISKEQYDYKQLLVAIPNISLNEYYEDELKMIKKYCLKNNIQCNIVKVGPNDE